MPEQIHVPADTLGDTFLGGVLAAGKLVATMRSKLTGEHITIRMNAKAKGDATGRWRTVPYAKAGHVFIDVPNQDGWPDRIGTYYPPHSSSRWAGSLYADRTADTARVWVARKLLDICVGQAPMESDEYEVLTSTYCMRCGKPLTDPISIEREFGPECYGKVTGSKHQAKQQPAEQESRDDFESRMAEFEAAIAARKSLKEARVKEAQADDDAMIEAAREGYILIEATDDLDSALRALDD